MRIAIFLALLITLHLSDCFIRSSVVVPKISIIVVEKPLCALNRMSTNFERVQLMLPTNKDTVIVWNFPPTRYLNQ